MINAKFFSHSTPTHNTLENVYCLFHCKIDKQFKDRLYHYEQDDIYFHIKCIFIIWFFSNRVFIQGIVLHIQFGQIIYIKSKNQDEYNLLF